VSILAESEAVDEFAPFGIRAFTTTRASGSFGLASEEPAAQVMGAGASCEKNCDPAAHASLRRRKFTARR
jgi:hypothetical protein